MSPADYLDAAKLVLKVGSDYALAAKLDLSRQLVCMWRKGTHFPDAYACAKLAITLSLDPAEVIADIQQQAEKNPARAEFWRSFLLRARCIAALVLCTLALTFSGGQGSEPAGLGGLRRRLRVA